MLLSSEKAGSAAVKLVDFGSAQVSTADDNDDSEALRPTASTPAYSPPEFLENKDVPQIESSFDMWALGVILYIMLSGVHPFGKFVLRGRTCLQLVFCRVSHRFVSLLCRPVR